MYEMIDPVLGPNVPALFFVSWVLMVWKLSIDYKQDYVEDKNRN